jgi:hypothetical protein
VLPVRQPPILVLGMPGCGTTLIGRTLADAPRALYFHEPLSEVHLAEHGPATFFEVDPYDPPDTYLWAARFAAAGVPAFGPGTVGTDSARWRFRSRLDATVVIKEVNPLAVDWYVRELSPRLVYVVRHPAAVAVSLASRGGDFPVLDERFLARSSGALPRDLPDSFWGRIGALQGAALNMADRALTLHDDHRVVSYELLCLDPMSSFKSLFAFCELEWTAAVADGVVRNTASMTDAWRSEITATQLAEVHAGWCATSPSRYTADIDWLL